jgi:hypothetical protein
LSFSSVVSKKSWFPRAMEVGGYNCWREPPASLPSLFGLAEPTPGHLLLPVAHILAEFRTLPGWPHSLLSAYGSSKKGGERARVTTAAWPRREPAAYLSQ